MKAFLTCVLSACCGMLVLRAVYAYAGADSHSAQSNGLDSPGLSQAGVGDTPQLKGSAAQPVAVPQPAATMTWSPRWQDRLQRSTCRSTGISARPRSGRQFPSTTP